MEVMLPLHWQVKNLINSEDTKISKDLHLSGRNSHTNILLGLQ